MKNNFNEIEKTIKGYGFDSLVFRYKMAREAQARLEYKEAQSYKDYRHDERYYMDRANRDLMRFIQILDELLGEHN